MQVTEHRRKARGLADLLLYDSLVEDGILLGQDGSLMAAWSFRGPDMDSSTHAEMQALSARLNSILRLGAGWMIHCDAIRSRAPEYPDQGCFPDAVTRVIDEERRAQFMAEGAHFESEYFLALTWLPPVEAEERVKGWMFEGGERSGANTARQILQRFRSRIESFEDIFSSLFQVERLKAKHSVDRYGFPLHQDLLLRYLHRCITGEDHPFALPDIPVHLNDVLASVDFVGGVEPQIGRKHIRVIAIDGFPKLSFPGILSALDALDLPRFSLPGLIWKAVLHITSVSHPAGAARR